MKDPVRTSAEVISCHAIRRPLFGRARRFNAVLELDVSVPDAPAYRVQQRCDAPTGNWPRPGGRLLLTVDRADPDRIRVHWGELAPPSVLAAHRR